MRAHTIQVKKPQQVVVYDSLEYCASLRNLDEIRNATNFKFVKGDIRSADLIRHVLATEHIDTIMHFAAQTHVDNSFGNSIEFTVSVQLPNVDLTSCLHVAIMRQGPSYPLLHPRTR